MKQFHWSVSRPKIPKNSRLTQLIFQCVEKPPGGFSTRLYLIPVAEIPSMNWFWKIRNKMIIGQTAITLPAITCG